MQLVITVDKIFLKFVLIFIFIGFELVWMPLNLINYNIDIIHECTHQRQLRKPELVNPVAWWCVQLPGEEVKATER